VEPRLDREEDILRRAIASIQDRLPDGWVVRREPEPSPFGPDALITVGPAEAEGGRAQFVIEVKRTIQVRDLQPIVDQLSSYARAAAGGELSGTPMIVARYLPRSTQQWLSDRDVAFADATGNLRVKSNAPPIFLRDVGATTDPWKRPGRPKGRLTGEPSARVVRALADFAPPYSVPRLMELSGASSGGAYRVVELLDDLAMITRAPTGVIEDVSWRMVLERWAQDYGFMRTNAVATYLAPRGIPHLKARLADVDVRELPRYVVTGSLATEAWEAYAPARTAMIYVEDPPRFADLLDLRPVGSGANVLLARNKYDVVFERVQPQGGISVAAPSQAAVDLLTGPGRNPAEAEALLDWMERNESDWRQ
jgi:hypothetical protein